MPMLVPFDEPLDMPFDVPPMSLALRVVEAFGVPELDEFMGALSELLLLGMVEPPVELVAFALLVDGVPSALRLFVVLPTLLPVPVFVPLMPLLFIVGFAVTAGLVVDDGGMVVRGVELVPIGVLASDATGVLPVVLEEVVAGVVDGLVIGAEEGVVPEFCATARPTLPITATTAAEVSTS